MSSPRKIHQDVVMADALRSSMLSKHKVPTHLRKNPKFALYFQSRSNSGEHEREQ